MLDAVATALHGFMCVGILQGGDGGGHGALRYGVKRQLKAGAVDLQRQFIDLRLVGLLLQHDFYRAQSHQVVPGAGR